MALLCTLLRATEWGVVLPVAVEGKLISNPTQNDKQLQE